MKRMHLLTAVLAVLLLTLCLAAAACAADIRPLDNEADDIDLKNGTFCLGVKDADKIFSGGYFTAALYVEDHYDGKQIEAIAAGDTVLVNGKTWTVAEVVTHTDDERPGVVDAYEIYTKEQNDGYIVFVHADDGCCRCVVDDWVPVTPVGDVRVTMPLPDRFRYVAVTAGEEEPPVGSDAFINSVMEYGPDFTPYNTTCVFEDGMLVRITHSSYPAGPEEEPSADGTDGPDDAEAAGDIPVWKFCHGVRDGLETAVVKAYSISCEEGPSEVGISEEEAEEMRRLAIEGVVTGKANGMGTTGGTWVYSFSTPAGEHLLSIELYQGWIVAADGMYNYR